MFFFVLSSLCSLYLLKMVSHRGDEESFCCANNNHVTLERLRNKLNRRTLKKKLNERISIESLITSVNCLTEKRKMLNFPKSDFGSHLLLKIFLSVMSNFREA